MLADNWPDCDGGSSRIKKLSGSGVHSLLLLPTHYNYKHLIPTSASFALSTVIVKTLPLSSQITEQH
jgi:hypothetical protein